MSSGKPAPSSRPTLAKLGADLRWLLEKSGLDPEAAIFSIGVQNESHKSLLISTFLKEFNATVMKQHAQPHILTVHGVNICIVNIAAAMSNQNPNQKPMESA